MIAKNLARALRPALLLPAVLASATALAAAAAVGEAPRASCDLEPYALEILSVDLSRSDSGARHLRVVGKGTTTLSGDLCPLAGRTLTSLEITDWGVDRGDAVTGTYSAEWDIDNDGRFDLQGRGDLRGVSSALDAGFTISDDVVAHLRGGATLRLQRRAVVGARQDGLDLSVSVASGRYTAPVGAGSQD